MTHRDVERRVEDGEAQLSALRDEVARGMLEIGRAQAVGDPDAGTGGVVAPEALPAPGEPRDALVDEIARQITRDAGLFPVAVLRQGRESFVELYAIDSAGKTTYGTAGYLGQGYFITVKHGVIALGGAIDESGPRHIETVTVRSQGVDRPARVVDAGNATAEVQPGDWAILQVGGAFDLTPLRVDLAYPYEFAEPIVRLGNDYSKGIILSTGYVGQRTDAGLITSLTDGHPGVSGGGVLNQRGELVGIPVGRMQGDYRFSFILPVRAEMFRSVPGVRVASGASAAP
jgi:hypothetical protein